MKKKTVKRAWNALIIALLVGAMVWIASRFWHPGVEWTDDAQVCRHITPVHTRVQGFVREVRFEEFQHVRKGDTLLIIDDAEYRLQLAQAEAALRGSRSGSAATAAGIGTTERHVQVAQAGISVASASVAETEAAAEEVRVGMENARKDFERYAALLQKGAVTQQQYDQMKTRYDEATARYNRARAAADAARAGQTQASANRQATAVVLGEQTQRVSQSQAGVSVAEAQLNLARLNLGYTVILAPCDGYVGRKDIHEGQLLQPGQLVVEVVDDAQVWVMAYYRESQMKGISLGAPVTFTADALPGLRFRGTVESISAATGTAMSGLRTDNATGNFVKVEQRIPVRITLAADNNADDVRRLLAGLNVEVEVSPAH
ncbi:MAG: HlyD family secretion protein [Alloprevotella sp.]|nr:HlyD family secretion protein [Alloprevotella sp.]MBR1594661.1 HlyD family secretion protein [Alloprevotella sp.]MBR1652950.1 HlyD family secretion protein [Alloprevotella sp.]